MEKKVNRDRTIHRLSTVLDLLNPDYAWSTGKPSVRVRYDYDSVKNYEEFTVLNHDISKESAEHIVMWLKENVKAEDLLYGFESNQLDVETINHQKKAA